MKASELMIGDWVRMRRCDIPDTTFYTSKVICLAKDGFLEYEPIPLTEEILKANAWYHDDCEWWYDSTTHRFMFKVYGYIKAFEGTLDYIHELQHALRLCGLTDLADNLKITP